MYNITLASQSHKPGLRDGFDLGRFGGLVFYLFFFLFGVGAMGVWSGFGSGVPLGTKSVHLLGGRWLGLSIWP